MIFSGCFKRLEDDVSLDFIRSRLERNFVWKVYLCPGAFVSKKNPQQFQPRMYMGSQRTNGNP